MKKNLKGEDGLLRLRKEYGIPRSENVMGYSGKELKAILTKKEQKQFDRWFYGQTAALDNDGHVLVYEWDLLRFIGLVRQNIPTYWD